MDPNAPPSLPMKSIPNGRYGSPWIFNNACNETGDEERGRGRIGDCAVTFDKKRGDWKNSQNLTEVTSKDLQELQ